MIVQPCNYLLQATVMVVSVTASTTQGKDLTKEELDTVATACDMAMELHESKTKIFEWVTDKVCFWRKEEVIYFHGNDCLKSPRGHHTHQFTLDCWILGTSSLEWLSLPQTSLLSWEPPLLPSWWARQEGWPSSRRCHQITSVCLARFDILHSRVSFLFLWTHFYCF